MKVFIFGLVFSTISMAQLLEPGMNPAGERGNGGDVVVCENKQQEIKSVEVLDIYEGRERGIQPALGGPALKYLERVQLAIERLRRLDPKRAKLYSEKAAQFDANTRFTSGELKDIPDSGYVPIPEGCYIEQIAEQRKPYFPEDRLYTIVRHLWDRLESSHKAALVLHEIVYGETLAIGQKSSVKARYFTSIIASNRLEKMPLQEYQLTVSLVFGNQSELEFKSSQFSWVFEAERSHTVNLQNLLNDPTQKATWVTKSAPPWVRIEGNQLELFPIDSEPNRHEFKIEATNSGGYSNSARVVLNIVSSTLNR